MKRAIERAIHYVGLELHKPRMILDETHEARLVLGGGKPEGWPHEIPPLSVEIFVKTNGDVLPARVFCDASDGDPVMSIAGAMTLKDCTCDLARLPQVLKDVWAERQELVARQRGGERVREFDGRFRWRWTSM